MKILTAQQIREADAYTIQHEPIASIDLMERASQAFCHWFEGRFGKHAPVMVFCGMGNNGGDGLAISRILLERGYKVSPYVIKNRDSGSEDFEKNLEQLKSLVDIKLITYSRDIPSIPEQVIVIDAIFGSGLSREPKGIFAETIKAINDSAAIKVAVDIASGLSSDHPSTGAIVRPDFTLTFQVPKLAFMMPENAPYTGDLVIADIGLSQDFIDHLNTPYHFADHPMAAAMVKRRQKFAHKGNFGKVLLVSGSWGKVGATVLCARACLRAGAGLLTVHVPASAYNILQTAVPEAMVETDVKQKKISNIKNVAAYDAIGVGPGLGTDEVTKQMLLSLLKKVKSPMVLDADALNILSKDKKMLKYIPHGSILTPHPKEFERLVGKSKDSFERLQIQQEFARKYHCIVIVKGAYTTICTPEGQVYFNSTGNPGMATGGSGDVLTGILTSLLGQGYDPIKAAVLGTYLHGLAGDKAADSLGEEAMLPSDLIDHIGEAYKTLKAQSCGSVQTISSWKS